MKRKLIQLSRRYEAALRRYLERGAGASLQPARSWGRQAAALKLETLDVANIHKGALGTLEASGSGDKAARRAKIFFAEAIMPIEETHRTALKTNFHLKRLAKTLNRRTVDLAVSRRSLKQGIIQRETIEQALKGSEEHSKKLLVESNRLQKYLQSLTHRILSAQENKRKKISRDLRDEVAQTLLGINVRLWTLKREAAVSASSLKKEIVNTQRLVDNSVKSIKRFAREFGIHHQTQSST